MARYDFLTKLTFLGNNESKYFRFASLLVSVTRCCFIVSSSSVYSISPLSQAKTSSCGTPRRFNAHSGAPIPLNIVATRSFLSLNIIILAFLFKYSSSNNASNYFLYYIHSNRITGLPPHCRVRYNYIKIISISH